MFFFIISELVFPYSGTYSFHRPVVFPVVSEPRLKLESVKLALYALTTKFYFLSEY